MCRLLSQVKEATQVHKLGTFLLMMIFVALVIIPAAVSAGVSWG